jgi:hypothetical protein
MYYWGWLLRNNGIGCCSATASLILASLPGCFLTDQPKCTFFTIN